MKFLISGSTGLIGSLLTEELKARGHEIVRLTRMSDDKFSKHIEWNPYNGQVDKEKLEGFDVIINLAGENISNGRWTPLKKKRIWDSRVLGSQNLSKLIVTLKNPPKLLINASAIGYYGEMQEEAATEETAPGTSFLANVCKEWEEAVKPVEDAGIRVVKLRTGVVLSTRGGALRKMLTPFKLCLGGKIGSGKQYMSVVTLPEVINIILFCIQNEQVRGPLNVVSKEPVTNLEFTKSLGRVLKRPTFFSVPAPVVKCLFGEMGEELLLKGSRVIPEQLTNLGYNFIYPNLEKALKSLLSENDG